mmetsp:Transcript_15741/g.22384  ORF Transcript_15741/g.22384 Transcript_15741/m.22384 type:complete len:232 (+) Transcript_15741:105-800(+)|eukprot:CAMPEP_0201706644 /NCGR_PEP_ID=MMETSP0578-20130828/49385_1 /ASSEMBLY_ACC=CAM_ASM_000663 /TAXON_ID=267565 /ORGANISM="Skeletonema grethea, Strain CCMP 1804" /LENGTH=231 /DNA_ID=CAMNT_0048195123 /DNA_START=84 /DNA_END=779 /DNA_ORIENTATION=-
MRLSNATSFLGMSPRARRMRSIFPAPRHAASDVASADGDHPAADNNGGDGLVAAAAAQPEEDTTDGNNPAADSNGGDGLLAAAAAQPEAVEDAQSIGNELPQNETYGGFASANPDLSRFSAATQRLQSELQHNNAAAEAPGAHGEEHDEHGSATDFEDNCIILQEPPIDPVTVGDDVQNVFSRQALMTWIESSGNGTFLSHPLTRDIYTSDRLSTDIHPVTGDRLCTTLHA